MPDLSDTMVYLGDSAHRVDDHETDVMAAELMLADGLPLPVDMTARLLDAGVDVRDLIARYDA